MGSGKISLVSTVVASVCIIVYISAIVFGAFQITLSINGRRVLADREFENLADRVVNTAAIYGFMTGEYEEEIKAALENTDTMLGVIVSGSNGQWGFEKRQGSVISWVDGSPRFKQGFGLPNTPYHKSVPISGQRNSNVQAQYSLVDYDFLLDSLKTTLTIILGSLALAIFALIIEISLKNRARYYNTAGASEPQKPHYREAAHIPQKPYQKAHPKVQTVQQKAAQESPAEDDSLFEEDLDFEDEDEPQAAAPVKKPEPEAPAIEEAAPEEAAPEPEIEKPAPSNNKPQGLYSPRSNAGWESYTQERLASELRRCASAEQDLSFVSIGYNGKNEARPEAAARNYRLLADETLKFFAQRDLIFEKGEFGFCVILPGTDLDQGIAKSEEFLKRVRAKFPGTFDRGLCIGLSSRSGRLVEAGRVMFESFSAVKKAREDPASPIIGFKTDLEKYRKFINRK